MTFWGFSRYHLHLWRGFWDWDSKVRNPVIVQLYIAVPSFSFSETEVLHLRNVTNSWSLHLSGLLGRSQAAEYSLCHSVPESPSSKGPRVPKMVTLVTLSYRSPKAVVKNKIVFKIELHFVLEETTLWDLLSYGDVSVDARNNSHGCDPGSEG